MTAWPDGTALWVRGTNEVVDEREGLPPSISPVNTSCEGQTVTFNSPRRTFYTFSKHLKASDRNKVETLRLDESVGSEPDVFIAINVCDVFQKYMQITSYE